MNITSSSLPVGAKFDQAKKGTFPAVPISVMEMQKYEGEADKKTIKIYQENTGTILYTAVVIRPDIAFAASKL
ncbi:hypothetical protein E4U23_007106 [Claviceps purpurea]|nr:hypothetical protein E4U23_007106 [Claviceps purpurea]